MNTNLKIDGKLLKIFEILFNIYGEVPCPLNHNSPFQLLVAVMLSAQCTDKKVNSITPCLFKNYPNSKKMSQADISKIENIIHSIGLFRTKAKNLVNSAKIITKSFNGKVPQTMHELLTLPGVGRKTANVVLGNAFDLEGFPVDTHVKRLLNRLGIVSTDSPEKIEYFINQHLPSKYWKDFSHLLITHGRACCKAQKPNCSECKLTSFCNHLKIN
jgi:endonuclease-3